MHAFVSTNQNTTTGHKMDPFNLIRNGHFWGPIVVETWGEKDYLDSLCIVIGKEVEVLVNGVHEPRAGVVPTFVKIDIPL